MQFKIQTHLSHLKFDSSDSFAVCDGEVRRQGRVSDNARESVAVLVGQPFTLSAIVRKAKVTTTGRERLLFSQVGMA